MFSKQSNYFNQFRAINVVFFQCLLFILFSGMTTTLLSAQDTFISEIYFQGGNTGNQEAIEIAGQPGTSLQGWQIQLYDGATGMVYDEHTFGSTAILPYTTTIENQDYGVMVQYFGINGIQDGSPDGVALINSLGLVQQFISYGGTFIATNGVAIGQPSWDVGVDMLAISTTQSIGPPLCFYRIDCPTLDELVWEKTGINLNDLPVDDDPELNFDRSIYCGIYTKTSLPTNNLKEVYLDRFGNTYTEEELTKPEAIEQLQICNPYPFLRLRFSAVDGADPVLPEEEAAICAAFTYLFSLINTENAAPVTINVEKAVLNPGIGGVGSPLFYNRCGVQNSIIMEQVTLGNQLFVGTSGIFQYSSLINWSTDFILNDVPNTQVDLFSVALHEALHILGFASRIGADGTPLDRYNQNTGEVVTTGQTYTRWDTHLKSLNSNQQLIKKVTTPNDCCGEFKFNTTTFSDMPCDVINSCDQTYTECSGINFDDIVFDIQNIPRVHGFYNEGTLSIAPPSERDGTVANILSHLNEDCISPNASNFVMHSSLTPGQHRRILASEELDILCKLGYIVGGDASCDDCNVTLRDDGTFILPFGQNLTFTLGGTEINLLENDLFAMGSSYTAAFCPDTPDSPLFSSQPLATTLLLEGNEIGSFNFCYSITSCGLCFEGYFTVIVVEPKECNNAYCACDEPLCNIACFTGFQDFEPGAAEEGYYPQVGFPGVDFGLNNNNGTLSTDVAFDGTNRFIRMRELGNDENLLIPFSQQVEAGCNLTIQLDIASHQNSSPSSFHIYASREKPCIDISVPVNGQTDAICSQFTPYAIVENQPIAGFFVDESSFNNSGNLNFTGKVFFETLSFTLTNVPDDLNWLLILADGAQQFYLVDNITAYKECPGVSVTALSNTACIDETTVVLYEVCATGIDVPTVTLTANLPTVPGLSLSGEGDFVNGVATINNLEAGECITVALGIQTTDDFLAGNSFDITIDVDVPAACADQEQVINTIVVLNNIQPASADFTYTIVEGCTVDFQGHDRIGFMHSWDFGDGSSGSTEAAPTHTFPASGTYTVRYLVSNDCGTETAEKVIEVDCGLSLCPNEIGIVIGEDENSITNIDEAIVDFGLPSSITLNSTTNTNITVYGTLSIHRDYEFRNCHFLMAPGAALIVEQDVICRNFGPSSSFSACNNLWRGIEVRERALFAMSNTLISDAQYAVMARNKSDIRLFRNRFERNFVGFYIPENTQGQGLANFQCLSNTFICSSDLNVPHPTIPLQPIPATVGQIGDIGYAGIWIHDVSGLVIGSSTAVNSFDQLANGIVARNSSLTVNSPQCSNILFEDSQSYGNVARGYGIYAIGDGDALVVNGQEASSTFSFDNCTYGILSVRSHTDILNVTMNDVFRGIDVEVAQNLNVNITDNTLNCIAAGVLLFNNSPVPHENVTDNIININLDNTYAGGTGINLRDAAGNGSSNADIILDHNTLQLRGTFSGIHLENQHYAQILNNTITTSNATGRSRGIQTSFGGDLVFKDNSTLNNGADNSSTAGFFIQNTPNTAYCCNTTGGWLDGLVFLNDCSSSPILGTEIQTNRRGWFMNGPIGQQITVVDNNVYYHGNKFTGNYSVAGASYSNNLEEDLVNSRIFVPVGNSQYKPANISVNAGNPDDWLWEEEQGQIVFDCLTGPTCEDLVPQIMELNAIDEAIAQGENLLSSWKTALNWEMQRNLYQKINVLPQVENIANGSIFEAFYLQHSNSNIGQFYDIEQGIEDLFTLNQTEKDSLEFYYMTEQNLMNLIESLQNSLLAENLSVVDSLALEADKKAAYQNWNEMASRRKAMMTTVWQNRILTSNSLIVLNNTINAVEEYEQNEVIVNDIFLQTIGKNILKLTSDQTTLLSNIANQCPEIGGVAVVKARSLLTLNRSLEADNYFDNCEEIELRKSSQIISPEPLFSLFPNPTTNTISLKAEIESEFEELSIQVYNLTGQEIKSFSINRNSAFQKLDVSDLDTGIYFFRILSKNEIIQTEKMVIL